MGNASTNGLNDCLVIGTDKNAHFRAYAAVTGGIVEEARQRHQTSATASAALGRTLTAGVLMSANLKGEDLLTIRVLGDGPLGAIVVTADAAGNVRGYVQCPGADPPSRNGKLDVGAAVGKNGSLSVSKNMGLKDPYTGSIPLVSGEIGEEIAHYYARSEQIPSVVALGVLVDTDTSVKTAGGYLVQAFPGVQEEELETLEKRTVQMPNISQVYSQGLSPEEVLGRLLGPDCLILEKRPVCFRCGCSRRKVEQILMSMGEDEIRDCITSGQKTEIDCHFCGQRYSFANRELQDLLNQAKPD